MSELLPLSRREWLLGAGALVVSTSLSTLATAQEVDKGAKFGAMVAVLPDGSVHFTCPSSEMGQGTQEALARLVAEELDCDWGKAG